MGSKDDLVHMTIFNGLIIYVDRHGVRAMPLDNINKCIAVEDIPFVGFNPDARLVVDTNLRVEKETEAQDRSSDNPTAHL